MTCEDCIYEKMCCKKHDWLKPTTPTQKNWEYVEQNLTTAYHCRQFKDKSKYIELPFIAMIEQHLVDGKFVNNSLQNWNGKYTVVYIDQNKFATPLIDICGKSAYNVDEAQERLKELLNDN